MPSGARRSSSSCPTCLGEGEILRYDPDTKSRTTMPCPECAMTPEERATFDKTERIVYWDKDQDKWIEADEWAAKQGAG